MEFRTNSLDEAARVYAPTYKSENRSYHYFPLLRIEFTRPDEPAVFIFRGVIEFWKESYRAEDFARSGTVSKTLRRRLELMSHRAWRERHQSALFTKPSL